MAVNSDSKIISKKSGQPNWLTILIEIGKWGVVVWLLWPLQRALTERIGFVRIMLGILLFIIFAGKLFYDNIISQHKKHSQATAITGLFNIIAITLGMVVIVGAAILFIILLVMMLLQNTQRVVDEA